MKVVREQAAAFQDELRKASSVLIGTHLNPDGDALGCALAFSLYLDSLGIENEVMCHHKAPKNLEFLPKVDQVHQEAYKDHYDLGVVLDLDAMDRLGRTEKYFATCKRLMVIDHHIPHDAPGDVRIVDTSAPATAVILTRLLMEVGANITGPMATCLLAGIVTDTGSFRFRNTTPDALSISAYLLEQGGDLKLACDNRLAWAAISNDDFRRTGALDEDTEGFVNEILSITSVQIAVLLREPKPGKVRVSIRSRGNIDIAEVARDFGGGGHKNAAGCVFELPLPEVEERLVRRLKVCLESC
jgi:phosphoesterase RecJ-like protein